MVARTRWWKSSGDTEFVALWQLGLVVLIVRPGLFVDVAWMRDEAAVEVLFCEAETHNLNFLMSAINVGETLYTLAKRNHMAVAEAIWKRLTSPSDGSLCRTGSRSWLRLESKQRTGLLTAIRSRLHSRKRRVPARSRAMERCGKWDWSVWTGLGIRLAFTE